jgi:tRNA threonylcarbamoyladenosine biosynthesis protein TsaE
MLELVARDAEATMALGAHLAKSLAPPLAAPLVLTLSGELGTGKTTLVRGFLGALGVAGPVRSPTYTLLEEYAAGTLRVAHLDLYRVRSGREIEELGVRELLDADRVLLIEWPERGAGALPAADLLIDFQIERTGRRIRLEARTGVAHALLDALRSYSGTLQVDPLSS